MARRNQPPNRLPENVRDHSEVARACREWNVGRLFRVINNLTEEPTKFTVTHIGRVCGLSVSRVGEYMKETRQVTTVGIIERIADGLHIPGERFGLVPRPWENEIAANAPAGNAKALATSQMKKASESRQVIGSDVLRAAAGREQAERFTSVFASLALLSGTAEEEGPSEGSDQICDELARFLCEWVNTMNRRELLQLLGWTATTIAAFPAVSSLDTDEQQRLARAMASPSRVDEQIIDHIDVMLRHIQLQEDALGSRAVLPMALAQRSLTHGLLAECPAALRPRLLSIYSNISTSIGYYFFELDDINSARLYYEHARAAAHEAGSADLSTYALCEWSYTESWQGQAPTKGLDLAAAAQGLASKAEDPLVRVGAAQRAATAYAFDGQHRECMVELERAQTNLEAAVGSSSPESPGYFYNEGYLTSHRSECLLRLGKPQEAAASAIAGLILYDKSFADGYAVCTLHLGNAHLQSGEIDEAARVVGNAGGLAAQTRSARLANELRITRARMQPWQDTHAVKELDDHLVNYGLAPNPTP